jgi:fructose-specific phosphotransferase system IIC component
MSEQKLGRSAIFPATIAAALSLVVVTVFNGRSGFLGGLLASITVIIFFSVQLLVARISRDLDPTLTMLLAMISYFAKVILMGVFLVLIGRFTDRSTVDRTSFAISALVITMIWLATEIRSFTKIRFQMPLPKGTSDEKE